MNFHHLLANTLFHIASVSDNEIYIDGYNIVRNDRNRNGGGVIIYVHSSLNHVVLEEYHNQNLELACIEVKVNKQKPFILLSWYRPPNSCINVFNSIENVLQSVEARYCDYVLVGDLNCDLLHKTPSNNTIRLRNIAEEFCLTQCVTMATRVTKNSQTLIDHVFTSKAGNVSQCKVLPVSLSDHEMVIFSWRKSKPKSNGNHCYISSRNMRKIDIENFVNELKDMSLDETLQETSTDKAYDIWVRKIRSLLDKHAPIKKKRVRQKKSPWMTSDIVDLIRERDKAKQSAKRINTDHEWLKYRKLRNHVKPQSHYSDNQSPTSRSRQPSATISNQFPTKMFVLNRSPTVCRPIDDCLPTGRRVVDNQLPITRRLIIEHTSHFGT